MPFNIIKKINEKVDRKQFIKNIKKKNIKKLPMQNNKKNNVFKRNEIRMAIRKAAKGKNQIEIVYTKTTTNETKTYKVAPYSYRYKKLKIGRRKMLFAYDMKEKSIKMFSIRNVKQVKVFFGQPFVPKWKIEII